MRKPDSSETGHDPESAPLSASERLAALLESIGDGFVSFDEEWRFIYVNARAEKLLGAGRETLIGRTLTETFPEISGGRFQQMFLAAREGKGEVHFEDFYAPLGKWFEVRAYRHPGGVSVHFQDVSGRRQKEEELRQSEELYRTLVENIDLGITLIDENHRILKTNAAQGRLFGKPASQFIQQHCFREFEKRESVCPHCPGTRALQTGRPASAEAEGMRDDGSRFAVQIHAYPVFDADGRARKFIEVVEDITARRLARENLRRSEERFRSVFENSAAGMAIVSPEGKFERVNRALCRFLGYPEEELLQFTMADLTHPDDYQTCLRHGEEVRAGRRQMVRHEKRYRRKDGSIVWGDATTNWILNTEGRPFYCIIHVIDTTERRQAEEAALQSKEALKSALAEARDARDRVDAILKSIEDGLLVTDRQGRVVLMNRGAEDLLGIRFADAIGWPIASVIRDPGFDHQPGATCLWERGEAPSRKVLRARNFEMRGQEGAIGGRITIVQDVTLEHQIDRLKSEFLSTAAHELRTPLAAIMGFTELLQHQEGLSEEQRQEYLSIVYGNSEELANIIDDLLNLSRIEAGRPVCLNLSPFDLRDELVRLLEQFRAEFPRNPLVAELPGPLPVRWDRTKIAQALENLIGNAVKFSPGGEPVHIEAAVENGRVRVVIRDLGIGMTAEQLEHAFDIFYRADASNTAVRGLGIGLSLARGIVEAHGGRIDIESAPGQGTMVTLLIPAGESAKD